MRKTIMAIRETCVAGKTIDRTIKLSSGNHRNKRAAKRNITEEKVKKNNERLAIKNLMRILNANFCHKDLHIVLTYAALPTLEEGKKDRKKFINSLRKSMAQTGTPLKYVAATEYLNKRPHHHLVINTADLVLIESLWTKGWVKYAVLDDTGNYHDLAEYLIKETSKTFRSENNPYKKRYASSANLIKPIVKREYVELEQLEEDPEPLKGYYIPKEHIRRYEHPVTGIEHLEYIMVALEQPRKYKVWPKGKTIKQNEFYKTNYIEDQQTLDWSHYSAIN